MSVLVVYATRGGGTRRQAEHVAESLRAVGVDADVMTVGDVASVDGYDAVLVGSPVRTGEWRPAAVAFLKRHRCALSRRLVWLFQTTDLTGASTIPKRVLALAGKAGAIGVLTLEGRGGAAASDLTLPTGASNEESVPQWAALIASAIKHRTAN